MANPQDPLVRPARPSIGPSPTDTTADTVAAVRVGPPEAQIGPYRMLSLLGSGGMGDVFLAYDDRLQRHVAVKRIRLDAPMTQLARERLRREAAVVATLSHPAVVHIYDILDEPSGEAIVMEYVEGRTLAEVLAEGRLPARQAVGIARQVAEGLAAAHALGVIHRDLKTQNVMVTSSGQAKILDFGLAKRLAPPADEDALTGEGALLGTTRAMSPEQAEGRALDARSDLFSLGVLLYEVCTGRSPFLGDNRAQTLRRVIAGEPPAIGELNPDLPVQLTALIGELLEKDPARRPAGAARVAERLAEVEQLPALRTLALPDARDVARSPDGKARRAAILWPAVGAVALLTAAVAVRFFPRGSAPARPVAVLVQEPRIESSPPDERTAFAAFAVRDAALRTLPALEGIEPIGPDDLPPGALSVQEAARAVAADEVVVPAIACQGQWCRVSLRRHRGRDARIVGNTGSFDVSSEPEDSLALANAVAIHLREAFPDHRPRATGGQLEVRSADYPRYLSLRRRMEAGEMLGRPEIDTLEQIARTSPGLTEAYILGAGTARALPDRPRAERLLREAEARHPGDPRLVYERFALELETGQVADAEAALVELEKRAPGDILAWRARAALLARQGRLQEAAEANRRMVRERPSWKNLWYVADAEIELADAQGARRHLEQLLQVSPGNARGLAKMAELEWLLGDPRTAARIYEGLLKEKVTINHLSSLGWSLLLAGEYGRAAQVYRQALALKPDHFRSRMNLGIAEEGTGDVESARRGYRDVLDLLAQRERTGPLTVSERLVKAQALARLGDSVPAVALTMQALAEGDRDPQVVFQAAIIYALCGEQNHAIVQATEARRRGLSTRWFSIPGFESLRASPAFRELLAPA